MTLENSQEDLGLVGPRNEDILEKIPEDMTIDGKPIWMAFLGDPEAINVSKDETEAAKNALKNASNEVVDSCRRVPLKECINKVNQAA